MDRHARQESCYQNKTQILGCQHWCDAASTGQNARVRRVQRRTCSILDDPSEQQVHPTTRMEPRISGLVLLDLLGETSPGGPPALPVQCPRMQLSRFILQRRSVL